MQDCTGCSKNWHVPGTLESWYRNFLDDIKVGELDKAGCDIARDPTLEFVPSDKFYDCLRVWFETTEGRQNKEDIVCKDVADCALST